MKVPSKETASASPTTAPFHVAIIGGGIGGLALAAGLRRHGVSFTIYEAAPTFSTVGAGIGLGPNALRAMDEMAPGFNAAFDALSRGNWDPKKEDIMMDASFSSEGYGVLEGWRRPVPWRIPGFRNRSAHRRELLDLLISYLPPEAVSAAGEDGVFPHDGLGPDHRAVRFGMRATCIWQRQTAKISSEHKMPEPDDISREVRIEFDNGEVAEADAVIGCDGVKGLSRSAVLGERHPDQVEAKYTGRFVYRSIVPIQQAREVLGRDLLGDEIASHPRSFLGEKCLIVSFPINGGTAVNFVAFVFNFPWTYDDWTQPVSKEILVRDLVRADVDHRLVTMVERGSGQLPLRWALHHHPATDSYYNGRVCLLGDSAHAMLPHHGAGAGQCIEDALVLSSVLGLVTSAAQLEAAFAAYDTVRRPRGQSLVDMSHGAGELCACRAPGYGLDLKKVAEEMSARFKRIWEYDVLGDVEKAKADFLGRSVNQHAKNCPG